MRRVNQLINSGQSDDDTQKQLDKLLEMIDRKEDASMTEDEKKVYKLLRKRSDNNESRGTTSIW